MIREVLGAPLWARTSHIVIFPSVCRWRPRTQESQQQAANMAEKPRKGCARNSGHCLNPTRCDRHGRSVLPRAVAGAASRQRSLRPPFSNTD